MFVSIFVQKIASAAHTDTQTDILIVLIYTRADARRGEWLQGGWIRADARLRADARGPG